MTLPFQARAYEKWAPFLGRVLFAALFLMAASGKIPGTPMYAMEVGMTAAAGVPFPEIAVFLALIVEGVGGLMLLFGWNARLAAFVLGLLTALLTAVFHMSFAGPAEIGQFISHLGLIAGLLYVSVYGAQSVAVKTCPLPQGMSKS